MSETPDRLAGLSPAKRALLERMVADRRAAADMVRPRPRPERMPLSFGQERLWVMEQLAPGTSAYNVPIVLWLDGPIDDAALDRALAELVGRHEALRTTVPAQDGQPYQRIAAATDVAGIPIEIHDLSALPPAEAENEALKLARRTASAPFNPAVGPLIRALRVRLSASRTLLAVVVHHIVVDGWSLGVLLRELSSLYNDFAAGRPSTLPAVPLQYADYTLWNREWMEGERMERQVAYWHERLEGCPTVLDLPVDRPRPAVQSFRGETARYLLPAGLYAEVEQFSRRENVTPFMVVFAIWTTLLHRYTGQADVPVGLGIANRNRPELEPVVGFFVNTLVQRTRFEGDLTFRDLLAQVRQETLGSQDNQDAPLSRVLDSLHLERSASHTPLVQVMFFFQNYPQEHISLTGLTAERIPLDVVHTNAAQSDISFYVNQDAVGELLFQYSSDLFDRPTIDRMAGHFETLLRGAIDQPAALIGDLPLLTAAETQQLRGWNSTARDYPGERPMAELFTSQVERTPDAVAVTFSGRDVTYRELLTRATELARRLRARGVHRGSLVGLYVERSIEMLVGQLGILLAGAGYVPLDPSYPADRLAFMLADAGAEVVVTRQELRSSVPVQTLELMVVDATTPLADCEGPAVASDALPDDLAYVIFTSGSTGRPKGVQVTQRAAINLVRSVAVEPGQQAGDVLCAVSTLSFDIALFELFVPLTVGARILLVDRDTARDGLALAKLVDRSPITIMQATPATWRMLLEIGWHGKPGMKLITTGEACPRELADRLVGCAREVWNLYGPTETTVYSTLGPVVAGSGPISIGKPVANTQIHIVDRRMNLLPAGVPGELLIGGDGLARGYLGRPDLTAEKFIPDPFSDRPGARLYRAGDLAAWRLDGTLEVRGRMDHQVKLRGFRIELGEIEAALAELPSVDQAVVHVREDRPGDKRLVAYVTSVPGSTAAIDELRAHLRRLLPDYMVPAAFLVLEHFPLTPNGKVNRHALPAPEMASDGSETEAPQTPDETTMAAIWSQVLGRESVGRNENFFDLGGHSLLAAQLLSRAQNTFGVEIPLRVLFDTPTVAGLAAHVAQARAASLEGENLDDLLRALEGLSDDEAAETLAARQGGLLQREHL
jgi:amino acid adenylation domain-containing protein